MAEDKNNDALNRLKAKQDEIAQKAAADPTNDVAQMAAKQAQGKGNQEQVVAEAKPADATPHKGESKPRDEASVVVDEKVDESLVAVDEIEAARDKAKILAGVVPVPDGSGQVFAEIVQKKVEEFHKKTADSRKKFDAQQQKAFGHIKPEAKKKEAQVGDSPVTVNAVQPEHGPGGPSDAGAGSGDKATASGESTSTSAKGPVGPASAAPKG